MTRVSELRTMYQTMATNSPEQVQLLYQGVLMGIDLASGAAAQDYAEKLESELAAARALAPETSGPAWRKSSNGKSGTRNMELPVQIYGITDPRVSGSPIFYVGSAQDPEGQLQDYIRSEGDKVKVSAKPTIDEIIGDGQVPGIEILEQGVLLKDANDRKNFWMDKLGTEGVQLVNQRRNG